MKTDPYVSVANGICGGVKFQFWRALLAALTVFPIIFGMAMSRGMNRDEGQHVAAGMLWAQHSLLPYLDYAWFHTPYLPFVYGCIFKFTDQPFLAARTFSCVCASLTVGLIFAEAWRISSSQTPRLRRMFSLAAVVLLIAPPLFTYGMGFAWNQEVSVLFAVGSVLLLVHGFDRGKGNGYLLFSGIALSIAVGLRITIAPLALPLALMVAFFGNAKNTRRRLIDTGLFILGGALGALPMLVLYMRAPEQFIFGNMGFAKANLLYLTSPHNKDPLGLDDRFTFLVEEIIPRQIVIIILILMLSLLLIYRHLKKGEFELTGGKRHLLPFMLLPFLLMGAMAPTPLQIQYFYPLLPFLVLGIFYLLIAQENFSGWARQVVLIFTLALITLPFNYRPYVRGLKCLISPNTWVPRMVHQEGLAIKQLVGQGRVLTLSPIPVLEGGLDIYPAFATGPFAWRVAPFIPEEKRKSLGLFSAGEITPWLDRNPPTAFLLGRETRWEKDLVNYAKSRGYQIHQLPGKNQIWHPPSPR